MSEVISCEVVLLGAGVNQVSVDLLSKEDMLNAELLRQASAADLKGIGLTLGAAMKVKQAYPSAQPVTASAPAAGTQGAPAPMAPPVMKVVLTAAEPRSDAQIVSGVMNGVETDIAEAKRRWGAAAVFVMTADNKIDVAATVSAITWVQKNGATERFGNSDGNFVLLKTLGEILSEDVELNPLTLRPVVPGCAMAQASLELRLLIAFAVATGVISADADEDQVLEAASAGTQQKWKNATADLAAAKASDSDNYRATFRRVRCKSNEVQSPLCKDHGAVLRQASIVVPSGGKRLNGAQQGLLQKAILDIYIRGELAQDMLFELNESLDDIVAPGSFSQNAMQVAQWANNNTRVEDLVAVIVRRNSKSAAVRALQDSLKS